MTDMRRNSPCLCLLMATVSSERVGEVVVCRKSPTKSNGYIVISTKEASVFFFFLSAAAES